MKRTSHRGMLGALACVLWLGGCAVPQQDNAGSAAAPVLHTTPRQEGRVDVWVRATVPPGSGDVFLTGNLPELGPWRPAARRLGDLESPDGPDRVMRLSLPIGHRFEFVVTQGGSAAEHRFVFDVRDTTQVIAVTIEAWSSPADATAR